eukprot:3166667-Alexandrium_andersonii.AAC.1
MAAAWPASTLLFFSIGLQKSASALIVAEIVREVLGFGAHPSAHPSRAPTQPFKLAPETVPPVPGAPAPDSTPHR